MNRNAISASRSRILALAARATRLGAVSLAPASIMMVGSARVAWAQGRVASVASLQRIAERRSAGGPWIRARRGTGLLVGDLFHTGDRSKADLKFTDGSLLRLGRLASIEFRSPRAVALSGPGQLLAAALSPIRIIAGGNAAQVKGSVALVRLNADGSMDAELFIGSMDVVSPLGTVTLLPGQAVTARADGTFSPIRRTSPPGYLGGQRFPELLEGPLPGPFAGSLPDIAARNEPDRAALAEDQGYVRGESANGATLLDYVNPNFNATIAPYPLIGTRPGFARSMSRLQAERGMEPPLASAPAAAPLIEAPIAPPSAPPSFSQALQGTRFSSAPTSSPRLAGIVADEGAQPSTSTSTDASGVGEELASESELDLSAARRHLDEVDRSQGNSQGADLSGLYVRTDGGGALYGADLRAFDARGRLFTEVEARPLRFRRRGEERLGLSSFPAASLTFRDKRFELQAGRQRFLGGPAQGTLFGSMVRQGSRQVMDAIRIGTPPGRSVHLEAAYLIDAFPRNLPYRTSGKQRGFYGRAAITRGAGSLGLNVLDYSQTSLSTKTGVTIDFAIPIVRDKIDFYGETGRDPLRHRISTFGLAFPILHDRTGVDFLLEYANLGGSRGTATPPTELTALASKRIGNNVNVVASLSRFSGSVRDTSFTIGVAIGGRLTGRQGTDDRKN